MATSARELGARKAAVLRALVRHYIQTGEPVGSEALTQASGLGVSSATIRNELASLEELGYLTHPHTSAGRVPTDLGYRFFVDTLQTRPKLRESERRAVVHFFDEALADVDEILRGTTQLLSRLTRYASLALAPDLRESAIARAELIRLGSATLLLVVFDTGRIEKRIVDVPEGTTEEDVERISKLMDAFRGKSAKAAAEEAAARSKTLGQPDRTLLTRVRTAIESIDSAAHGDHVVLGGVANIATEEAFRRRETLRQVYEALERESAVLRVLRDAASAAPLSVMIGREIPVPEMWEAAVVTAPYRAGGDVIGSIGVVGPTRMNYEAAISAVRVVADRLSAAVEALRA